ncbi:MAG: endonuclease/exonuclease/phosphatase family protein [Anaerolineae bacterium]|nr:endonuclease/exonuclease/phosphatase family protein [Anaerolineae bacterium]
MPLTRLRSRLPAFIRFGGRLSIAASQIFVVALLAWQVLRHYPGDRWLAIRLGSYFAPWFFMALLPAFVIAWLGQRRRLMGAIGLLLLIFGASYGPLLTPRLAQVKAENTTNELRVMTFNVHYANRNAQSIADLIHVEKPDLIAIQELTDELALLLLPQLAAEYPDYVVADSPGFSKALLSRYPLAAPSGPTEVWCGLPAVVDTPGGHVVVWNVHPVPAVRQDGWERQHQALIALIQEIERENRPLIVLGDFNTTDQAENYRLVATRLTDVHRVVGRGFGFTFPEPDVLAWMPWYAQPFKMVSPVVRIDHIFVSEHFAPQETHVISKGYGSDHRPVVATLRFRDSP